MLTSISFARSKCFVFVVCMRYERPECVKTTQRMLGATFPCCFSLHSFFLFCLFVLLLVSCCLGPTEKKKKKSPDCYSTMQFCDFGLAFLGVVFFVYLRFTVFFSLAAGMRGSEVFFLYMNI